MKPHVRKTAELSMVIGTLNYFQTDSARINALVKSLKESANRALFGLKKIQKADVEKCKMAMRQFDNATKWAGRETHMLTHITFISALLEQYPGSYMHTACVSLDDELDTGGTKFNACRAAGALAFDKWQKICGKY